MSTSATSDRRSQVMVGELPSDFLRVDGLGGGIQNGGDPTQMQIAADQQAAQALQYRISGVNFATRTQPRLSITITQAKLVKNYGLVKMDPYCRVRVGHSVFETHTSHSGGKNPRWAKTIHCYIPQGVDSIYVEVFDEKAFTMDDRVAWGHITISEKVFAGDTVDEWFPLSGKQGDHREGTINLVFSYTQAAPAPAMQQVMPPNPQIMVIPGGMPVYYPPGGMNQPYPQQQQPQQQQPQLLQQQPVQQGPLFTDEDVKLVKDMFPNIDEEVIKSVLEANQGDKDATINNLLNM